MSTVKILEYAYKLINEVGWTQGQCVASDPDRITGFCLSGALQAIVNHELADRAEMFLCDLLAIDSTLCEWNDNHSKEEVLDLLLKAIITQKEGVKQ